MAGFQNSSAQVFEFQGVFETQVVSKNTAKAEIVFIKTNLEGNADESDIVPYDSLLVFSKGKTTTSLFITVKIDDKYEDDETFSIEILKNKGRNKRRKRGAVPPTLRITVTLEERSLYESCLSPDFVINGVQFLAIHVVNNARLAAKESDTIKNIYISTEHNKRLEKLTMFLNISEPVNELEEKYIMRAYYFPYKNGKLETLNDVGWVDIPYKPQDNQPNMAFTGGTNGCALVAMEKRHDDNMFRMYHMQSPGTKDGPLWNKYMDIIKSDAEIGVVIGSFAWEEYGIDGLAEHYQATNYLYYDTKKVQWLYVSQFSLFIGSVNPNNDPKLPKGLSMQETSQIINENKLYNGEVQKVLVSYLTLLYSDYFR